MSPEREREEIAVPDVYGAIVGYRRWDLKEDGMLHSKLGAGDRVWQPGVNRADFPPPHGSGGFHAWHTPEHFILGPRRLYGKVFGAILAWGEMSTSYAAFRAEFARIIGLAGKGNVMEDVAATYEVPLFATRGALAEEVARHGRSLDESQRGPKKAKQQAPNLELEAPQDRSMAVAHARLYTPGQTPRLAPEVPAPHIFVPIALGASCLVGAELVKALLL